MDDKTNKIARLAFDPSASEGEAIAAFLQLRKRKDGLKAATANVPSEPTSSSARYKTTWKLTITAQNFDAWFFATQRFKPDEPFLTFKVVTERKKILDRYDIEATGRFVSKEESDRFGDYQRRIIDELNAGYNPPKKEPAKKYQYEYDADKDYKDYKEWSARFEKEKQDEIRRQWKEVERMAEDAACKAAQNQPKPSFWDKVWGGKSAS